MVIIGLLLVAAAVALTAGVLIENTATTTLDVFGLRADLPLGGVFLLGAIALAALVLGVALMRAGVGRSVRKRREVKRLRVEHEQAMERLSQERAAAETRRAETEAATSETRVISSGDGRVHHDVAGDRTTQTSTESLDGHADGSAPHGGQHVADRRDEATTH